MCLKMHLITTHNLCEKEICTLYCIPVPKSLKACERLTENACHCIVNLLIDSRDEMKKVLPRRSTQYV